MRTPLPPPDAPVAAAPTWQERARSWSGYTFWSGNLTLLATNLPTFDTAGLTSSLLFLGASTLYPFTSKRPWLFAPAGALVIAAQGILAATATGSGALLQQLGTIMPMLQGAAMIRSAWLQIGGTPFVTDKPLLKPLEWIDKRPVLIGSALTIPGMLMLAVGAAMSKDYGFAIAAAQWLVGNMLMAASDVHPAVIADSSVSSEIATSRPAAAHG